MQPYVRLHFMVSHADVLVQLVASRAWTLASIELPFGFTTIAHMGEHPNSTHKDR